MRTKLVLPTLLMLTATACGTDVGITETAACDGILQAQETTVDDAFDRDGDGYFDANNPGCQSVYPFEILDCDDGDPETNPTADEITCNDIDDDCDPSTSDLDERNCVESYDGTWELDQTVSMSCAMGNVVIGFDRLVVSHMDPNITFTAVGTGVQPGSVNGTVTVDGVFGASNTINGSCTETYSYDGSFTSPNTLEGTFTAEFVGGFNCLDCSQRSWTFSATR